MKRRSLLGAGLGASFLARGSSPCVVQLEGFELEADDDGLVLRDAERRVLRRYAGSNLGRTRHGRASALVALGHRRSLLASWPALHEWWEIVLDPDAPPIFDGYVHDHRMGEAIASAGYLGIRRIPFDGPAPTPDFAPRGLPWLAAMEQDRVLVVHLDVRRTVARIEAPGAALAGSRLCGQHWWLPVGGQTWAIDARRWTVDGRHPSGTVRTPCGDPPLAIVRCPP